MRAVALCLPFLLIAQQMQGITDPSQLCDNAARRAARSVGVPLDLMLAIARVESGRDRGQGLAPWPWTINVGGDGAFFDAPGPALDHAERTLQSGMENVDIGCFQVNFRWHGDAFASLETMIDPDLNAEYAARLLLEVYATTGSWTEAVGAYHSRTADLAAGYVGRVDALLGGGLTPSQTAAALPGAAKDPTLAIRINRYPLLRPGEPGQGGSLVPATPSAGALFARAD